MTTLAIGSSYRYSLIEKIIASLNSTLEKEKLDELIAKEFPDMTEAEVAEEIGDDGGQDYFSDELTEMDKYAIADFGEEFHVGKTFVVIVDAEEDAVVSFVLDGYASEGVFKCAYIACDAPEINLESIDR